MSLCVLVRVFERKFALGPERIGCSISARNQSLGIDSALPESLWFVCSKC